MKERKAFGAPIAQLQGLRFMLADMAIRTEAARALVYRACATIDEGDPEGQLTYLGAAAKSFASDTAMSLSLIHIFERVGRLLQMERYRAHLS